MATAAPPAIHFQGYTFRLAIDDDDAALRALLRDVEIPGPIAITMEREPSFFVSSQVEGPLHQTIVCCDDTSGNIVGLGSRSVRRAYVNGEEQALGYLSQLRAAPNHRGRGILLKQAFRLLHELHRDGAAPLYMTTIVADSPLAQRVLTRDWEGKPTYELRAPLGTYVLALGRCRAPPRPSGTRVRTATSEDVVAIVDCLARNHRRTNFAPVWSAADIRGGPQTPGLTPRDFVLSEEDGRVTGCVALWDQSAFKQNVVRGYTKALAAIRPVVNFGAGLLGQPRLPAVGAPLRSVFFSHLAVDEDDPKRGRLLLLAAAAEARVRGHRLGFLGLAHSHPLSSVVERAFRPRRYDSLAYLVYWPEDAPLARAFDNRPIHVEMAAL
ncbi:MAG: hypothetical protein AAB426_08825 [Myxococcota bacterium]